MDGKDDSGIDCEVNEQLKAVATNNTHNANDNVEELAENTVHSKSFTCKIQEDLPNKGRRKSMEIQKKIEKHRSNLRKLNPNNNNSSQSKGGILSRNRLLVPSKGDVASETDIQPLVVIDIDDSEDEFAIPKLSKKAQRDMVQQLNKDGYNVDLEPDEDDLDLIPPRPLNERCICCNTQVNCCIQ